MWTVLYCWLGLPKCATCQQIFLKLRSAKCHDTLRISSCYRRSYRHEGAKTTFRNSSLQTHNNNININKWRLWLLRLQTNCSHPLAAILHDIRSCYSPTQVVATRTTGFSNENKNWTLPTVYLCCVCFSQAAAVLSLHSINPLKPELNPICYLLALLGAHHFLHVSRIRVKLLTFRILMS